MKQFQGRAFASRAFATRAFGRYLQVQQSVGVAGRLQPRRAPARRRDRDDDDVLLFLLRR